MEKEYFKDIKQQYMLSFPKHVLEFSKPWKTWENYQFYTLLKFLLSSTSQHWNSHHCFSFQETSSFVHVPIAFFSLDKLNHHKFHCDQAPYGRPRICRFSRQLRHQNHASIWRVQQLARKELEAGTSWCNPAPRSTRNGTEQPATSASWYYNLVWI